MTDQLRAGESGSSEEIVGDQPNQAVSGQQNTNPEPLQFLEGRSVPEKLCHLVHNCFPEEMDFTNPVVKRFTAFGLIMTVTFERGWRFTGEMVL